MNYQLMTNLGAAIDNVYKYTSEDGARKTIAKIVNNEELHITYMTILNIGRDSDLTLQMSLMSKETNDMISSRLKTIKAEFKNASGETLKTTKIGAVDNCETLTVSAFSPFRKLKYTCTYKYQL